MTRNGMTVSLRIKYRLIMDSNTVVKNKTKQHISIVKSLKCKFKFLNLSKKKKNK